MTLHEEAYSSAVERAQRGDYAEALRFYEQLLAEEGLSRHLRASVYNDLAVIARSMGEVQRAKALVHKAVFSDSLFVEAYWNLACLMAEEQPKPAAFSVIIPTYNRLESLRECIEGIRRCTYFPFEIVVVCDRCADGTEAYLRDEAQKGDIRPIFNDFRLGTIRSLNRGLDLATGDYVMILNDDAIPMPGWDLAIVGTIGDDPSAGCGIPLVIRPNGEIQSAGETNRFRSRTHPWIGRTPFLDASGARGRTIDQFPEIQVPRECDYGYFQAFKAGCLRRIGNADERFSHYFVDPDFGYRVQQAGLRSVYCPTSVVAHYELSRLDPGLMRQRFETDFDLFVEKWGIFNASRQ